MVALLAPVPLWQTASIVMVATLIYTRMAACVTIFTDRLQMLVILPFLMVLIFLVEGYR